MNLSLWRVVAAALLAFTCGTAVARAQSATDPINPDRPGFSDSPSTVGAGRLQIEAGGDGSWDEDQPGAYSLPVTLRRGIGSSFELRLESDTFSFEGSEHGFADLVPGAKWTFHRGTPTLGLMAHLDVPTGSRAFRGHGVTPDVEMMGSADLGDKWSIEAEALVAVPRDDSGGGRFAQTVFAATLGREVTERIQAFAELASLGADARGGRRSAVADAGAAYALSDDTVLDVDVIVGLNATAPHWGLTAGLSARF